MTDRFIPAYAGNSMPVSLFAMIFPGSSPLTRGTLAQYASHNRSRRFIPAYAGNSYNDMVIADSGSVHPRLRGELSGNESKALFHDGSSPLTRGTLRHDSAPLSAPRFIPAYAGNSRLAETSLAQKSVHPRLRGELFFLA